MGSDDRDERSPDPYRAVAEDSRLGLVLRLLSRPGRGQFEMAFGDRPRPDQRVGMLRKASATAGFNLVAGAIVGFTLAFYRGRRVGAYSWTEIDSHIASIAVGATLTYIALLLPLFVIIRFRRRIADRDHEAWLTRSKKRGRARFIPDPRSQPRPADLGISFTICLIAASPIWTLVL